MLINVVEEDGSAQGTEGEDNDLPEYQTANELFDLMAKTHNISNESESLTTRDLILLYKNIDLGTKLMSSANDFKRTTSNQYVETVVYHEEPDSDSDLSDIYSNEDLQNIIMINKERLDLLDSITSYENTLCHKFGELEIHTSKVFKEFDYSLFQGAYIKDRFQNLKVKSNSIDPSGTVLPISLLDYICCKRLEDNYNFYMDGVIKYVTNTIDHLKRISDGEYLTEKAKETWKKVEREIKGDCANNIVLAKSTSIPLHVEQKLSGNEITWDDIVHSEVDIRSLSKILEKKIVVEVPKVISGSFKLFTKCCKGNLIVRCKKKRQPVIFKDREDDSRLDVIFQLKRSDSGQVQSSISSIMVLKNKKECISEVLPLKYNEKVLPLKYSENNVLQNFNEHKMIIREIEDKKFFEIEHNKINEIQEDPVAELQTCINKENSSQEELIKDDTSKRSFSEFSDLDGNSSECISDPFSEYYDSRDYTNDNQTKPNQTKICSRFSTDALKRLLPDEFKLTIQQSSLPEESLVDNCVIVKKRSPTRNRIKSPYENKSHLIEERKRNKLLEIRQRRELKKMTMRENCEVNKRKYVKATVLPPTSSSVTKLSITNKSFYNSIYGQAFSDDKFPKLKCRKQRKEYTSDESSDIFENEDDQKASAKNSQKYINKNYFLDEAITEIMYIEMKKKENSDIQDSESTLCNEFSAKLNLLSQLVTPSITELNITNGSSILQVDDSQKISDELEDSDASDKDQTDINIPYLATIVADESSTRVHNYISKDETHKPLIQNNETDDETNVASTPSIEFRKSINKIYELMNELGKGTDKIIPKSAITAVQTDSENIERQMPSDRSSNSGSNIKEHPVLTNLNILSTKKVDTKSTVENLAHDASKSKIVNAKNTQPASTVVSKVVISTQTQKVGSEKPKKDRIKMVSNKAVSAIENPLNAISQLLHEFDNVQKTKQKTVTTDTKSKKIEVVPTESKVNARQVFQRKPIKDLEPKPILNKDRRAKINRESRYMHQNTTEDNKHMNRTLKKQVAELMDEFKEAQGEAVRGPRPSARLNSLAQPKRTYVQAQIEDFQTKHGKTIMSNRPVRFNGSPTSPEKNAGVKGRLRRGGVETVLKQSSAPPPPEIIPKHKAVNSSRESKMPLLAKEQSSKHLPGPYAPDTLVKNMVAVESCVKNHYGRSLPVADHADILRGGHQARVLVKPSDFATSPVSSPSSKKSAVVESNKHKLFVNSASSFAGLPVVVECSESTPERSRDSKNMSAAENCKEVKDLERSEAINNRQCITKVEQETDVQTIENPPCGESKSSQKIITAQIVPKNSITELKQLENALHHRIPTIGKLHKRLRIKNLTLAPQESMHQVLVLQSGDSSSVLVQSSVSSPPVTKSKSDIFQDETLPRLTQINWQISELPMQIATVGYGFPKYSIPCKPEYSVVPNMENKFGVRKVEGKLKSSIDRTCQCNKEDTCECYTGKLETTAENAAQTAPAPVTLSDSSNIYFSEPSVPMEQTNNKVLSKLTLSNNKFISQKDKNYDDSNQVLENKNAQTPESETESTSEKCDIEYTNSLDILVGLLNEIHNITTCQTQITKPDNQIENLENILRGAASRKRGTESIHSSRISITSLEKLRDLESKQSVCPCYLYNTGSSDFIQNIRHESSKPVCADKEVNAETPLIKEFVNTCTEVPSIFFHHCVNHSTNVSNSLLGVFSEPSTMSVISYAEHALHSNTSLTSLKKIIELPLGASNKDVPSQTQREEQKKKDNIMILKTTDISKTSRTQCDTPALWRNSNDFCADNVEFDPVMKMKRDILVTMYSVLVFTVFAALSFPDLLYRS